MAVGLDPEVVLSGLSAHVLKDPDARRRGSSWPAAILAAWTTSVPSAGMRAASASQW